MSHKRQKVDSAVASPTSARAWDFEAIGEFKLHTRLGSATRAAAVKVQTASFPEDLLALETHRPALAASTLDLVSARKMEQTLALLPSMRLEHQKAAASPIQRDISKRHGPRAL